MVGVGGRRIVGVRRERACGIGLSRVGTGMVIGEGGLVAGPGPRPRPGAGGGSRSVEGSLGDCGGGPRRHGQMVWCERLGYMPAQIQGCLRTFSSL